MSNRVFECHCQKCSRKFDFTGSYEAFRVFMDSADFTCPNGHTEKRSPRIFVKVLNVSEPRPVLEWTPTEGRKYVDILDYSTVRNSGMQISHLGSGLYIDRRTGKKYDYEEDVKGTRHYFEVVA